MATIDHLRLSILDMPREDGLKLIHTLRASRRTPPDKPRKKKRATGTRTPKNKNKKPANLKDVVAGMSAADKAKLAKELLGG